MKKSEVKKRIQEGFWELSPDVFESIQNAAEQERLIIRKSEIENFAKTVASQNSEDAVGGKKRDAGRRKKMIPKYAISFCAGLAVLVFCLLGIQTPDKKDRYFILDINPSIQVVFNESYQIEGISGLNQDGKEIIKQLNWKKQESIFDIMHDILQKTASEAYLKNNSGILVTICLPDQKQYDDLEVKLGRNIDQTLNELGISDVTAAFWQSEPSVSKSGREMLEMKLSEEYGMDVEEIKKMSMMELISYCRENTLDLFRLSPQSEKQAASPSGSQAAETEGQKKEGQDTPDEIPETQKLEEAIPEQPEKEPEKKEEKDSEEENPSGQSDAVQTDGQESAVQPGGTAENQPSDPVQPETNPPSDTGSTEAPAENPGTGNVKDEAKKKKKEKKKKKNDQKKKKKDKNNSSKKDKDTDGNKKQESGNNNKPNKKKEETDNNNSNKKKEDGNKGSLNKKKSDETTAAKEKGGGNGKKSINGN